MWDTDCRPSDACWLALKSKVRTVDWNLQNLTLHALLITSSAT